MSAVFNWAIKYLFKGWGQRVSDLSWWADSFPEFVKHLATQLRCPYAFVIGFVDGTFIETCRPHEDTFAGVDQQDVYNGHHKGHGLQFLSLMFPNGMFCLWGPYEGKRHDAYLMAKAGILDSLRNLDVFGPGGELLQRFAVFGDSAFPRTRWSYRMLKGQLDNAAALLNAVMSCFRQTVEWNFGKVTNVFTYVKFCYGLHIQGHPVGKFVHIAALLTNVHTTVYGCQTTAYFKSHDMLERMSLERYLDVQGQFPLYKWRLLKEDGGGNEAMV